MYKLQDRFSRPFALAPTHEELFAIAGKSAVRSNTFHLAYINSKQNLEMKHVHVMD